MEFIWWRTNLDSELLWGWKSKYEHFKMKSFRLKLNPSHQYRSHEHRVGGRQVWRGEVTSHWPAAVHLRDSTIQSERSAHDISSSSSVVSDSPRLISVSYSCSSDRRSQDTSDRLQDPVTSWIRMMVQVLKCPSKPEVVDVKFRE